MVGSDRIFGRRRRGVLGRKPILEREGARPGGSRQGTDEDAVGANRAEDEAAPVQVEQHGPICTGGFQPRALDRASLSFLAPESRGHTVGLQRTQSLGNIAPAHDADERHHRPRSAGRSDQPLELQAPDRPAPSTGGAAKCGGGRARDSGRRDANGIEETLCPACGRADLHVSHHG
jgi:hypothetical protein